MRVDLSNNYLNRIPNIQSRRLEVLWVRNNRIEVLDMQLMRYPLRQLRVAGNNIGRFYMAVLQREVDSDIELLGFINPKEYEGNQYMTLAEIMSQTKGVK